jgi:UDP-N-acetylmuramoylalanine--D-glutamate ligase
MIPPPLPTSAVVLGLGRSGRAAARFLRSRGVEVLALDSAETPALRDTATKLESEGIHCLLGTNRLPENTNATLGILSPGLEETSLLATSFLAQGGELISEIELAWRHAPGTTIAITGTNGKTTTTSLLAHLLSSLGLSAAACGNIGRTFCEVLLESPQTTHYALEISSFQLETCRAFRPRVAIWTNFSPNHLDRYPGVAEYFAAKARIFLHQTEEDWAVVQSGSTLPEIRARRLQFSAIETMVDFTLRDGWICFRGRPLLDQSSTQLLGPHNAENIMAALGAIAALDLDLTAAAAAVPSFSPPAHRCEPIREKDDVLWINDSKSTNLDSLEKALRSQNRPLILIAGGKDKGFSFAPLADFVPRHARHAVLIGQLRESIAHDWSGLPCHPVDSLAAAVHLARELAQPGDAVLFSPGTSSFDMFRDYEDRGDQFRQLVQALN